jgi:integrase
MTINHSFNDNILAISIKIDELSTSSVTLAKAMKTSYVTCSRNGWLRFRMQANKRPTAYGLRHTFIDEMKQLDISEHIVAQIVGHANPNITYSRYGKDIKVAALLKDIEKIEYQI